MSHSFIDYADGVNLDGVIEKITVPFLICELRIFTSDEGGAEHVGLDHLTHVRDFVADWGSETFRDL